MVCLRAFARKRSLNFRRIERAVGDERFTVHPRGDEEAIETDGVGAENVRGHAVADTENARLIDGPAGEAF